MNYAMETVWKILLLSCILAPVVHAMTSSSKKYVIEASVFVDDDAMKRFEALSGKDFEGVKAEVRSYIEEISRVLQGLKQFHINISMRVKNLVFLNNTIITKKTRSDKALAIFTDWVNNNNQSEYHGFDLALLFTGVKMAGTDIGYGYIGSICTKYATAVAELTGKYQAVITAAHEIGHILGGHHDQSKHAPDCYRSSGYIMGRSRPGNRNQFHYSRCTAWSIKDTLDKLTKSGKNCLNNTGPPLTETVPRFGELVTPDEVCRRELGPHAYFTRRVYAGYGEKICTKLACTIHENGHDYFYKYVYSPQGLACGKNKVCDLGRCVQGTANVDDSCPFGDQPKKVYRLQKMCSQLTPTECAAWQTSCCATCNTTNPAKALTADEVCRQIVGPHSSLARRFQGSYGDWFCSHLACTNGNPRWDYKQFLAPDGLTCGKGKRCQKGKCVVTPDGNQEVSDHCPWGDQPSVSTRYYRGCRSITRHNGCHDWKNMCCITCPH